MPIHIIYRDPLNQQLDNEREKEIIEKFSDAELEVAEIRTILDDERCYIQMVLFGNDEVAARKVAEELANKDDRDEIFLELLSDDDDKTEVRPVKR